MTKKELKNAKDNEIIFDYIITASKHMLNQNLGRGITTLTKHLNDLNEEMLNRGLLTKEQIDRLNS